MATELRRLAEMSDVGVVLRRCTAAVAVSVRWTNLSGDMMIDRWGADGGVAAKLRMSPARRSWSGSPSTAAVQSGCARPSNEITCAGAHSIVLLFVVGLAGWRDNPSQAGREPRRDACGHKNATIERSGGTAFIIDRRRRAPEASSGRLGMLGSRSGPTGHAPRWSCLRGVERDHGLCRRY